MRRLTWALAAGLAACLCGAAWGGGPKRPNFLFIYTDDQRWDALGVVQREQGERARFPWLRTPHLDRLAREGVRFRNAFVVNALCSPSRASFLTGKYGHANGVVNNHTPFPENSVTWATLLRDAGYRTGYVGKWHHGPQRGQRPGFDYSASFVGQGVYFNCPIEVNGQVSPSQGWVDDVSTDHALGFLKENRDRPFALVLGFKSSHGPFQPAERHKEAYAGEQARRVPNLDVPAIYNRTPGAPLPQPGEGPVPTNLGWFRCLNGVDENVGRVLQTLDELKLAENTVVVFSSDNGYYLGEHRLGDKRSAYEESMRVPLLVRYPRGIKAGRSEDRLALNVDLAPTFLDYAGVPAPGGLHGQSWRALLEGKRDAAWRKAFFYAYFFERGFRIPTVTAVRTETAKLIRYPGHPEWTELFDLRADPFEIKNLWAEPDAARLRKELDAEYERQSAAVEFRIPDFADQPTADQAPDGLKAWVLDYRFDQDQGDRVTDASGRNNHGAAVRAPLAEGRAGAKARRFDGTGHIEVEKSASLNPAVAGWTVEATIRAEKPDGVLAACGGASQGYALLLEQGRPVFVVVTGGRATRVTAPQTIGSDWATVEGVISPERRLHLRVNGKEVARTPLPAFIERQPNEGLQLGADLNTRVVAEIPPFTGLLERVRIHSGQKQ